MRDLRLTLLQAAYIREAHHRWNFAVGAVRSGKSHLAVTYTIPDRVMKGHGKRGMNLILGATRDNIERNVLMPMRDLWGERCIGTIDSRNQCRIFGEQVYCIGADNKRQASKIRGSEVKFCYCDEICDIDKEVFEILKSRLSLPYSECHAACNPAAPTHFIKKFIDSAERGVDIWVQHYTIYDNPFLPVDYVRSLEAEYRGTVYYDRYIRGLWTQAEGLVWPGYAACLEDLFTGTVCAWAISVDYGTQNPFAAIKWGKDTSGTWHAVAAWKHDGRHEGHQFTDSDYADAMMDFAEGLPPQVEMIVDPSATSYIAEVRSRGRFHIRHARNDVDKGVKETGRAMQKGNIRICRDLNDTLDELAGYVWDSPRADGKDHPMKVDDHFCDSIRYMVATKRLAGSTGAAYVSPLG